MSMAAKSSDLVDKTSGANLQTEGHVDVPTQSAMDPQEPEEEDSSPYHSPSWSLARGLPSSHPNMKYCLEIQVTLTLSMPHMTIVVISHLAKKMSSLELLHATQFSMRLV